MKKLAVIITLFSLFAFQNAQAGGPGKKYSELRNYIIEKVASIKNIKLNKSVEKIDISFRIEEDNTFTLIAVLTKNSDLEAAIYENLDFKNLGLDFSSLEKNIDYWITIDYTVL